MSVDKPWRLLSGQLSGENKQTNKQMKQKYINNYCSSSQKWQVHNKACAGGGSPTVATNSAEQQLKGEGGPGGEHDGEAGQAVQGEQHGEDVGHPVQDGGDDHEVAQQRVL